jgi:hypothetical protein
MQAFSDKNFGALGIEGNSAITIKAKRQAFQELSAAQDSRLKALNGTS